MCLHVVRSMTTIALLTGQVAQTHSAFQPQATLVPVSGNVDLLDHKRTATGGKDVCSKRRMPLNMASDAHTLRRAVWITLHRVIKLPPH